MPHGAVRCIDCNGNGAVAQVIAGLEWVAANYRLPAVASMSLGSNAINQALDSALQAVIALGVVGVVAAGNYGSGGPWGPGYGLSNSGVLGLWGRDAGFLIPWCWALLEG